MKKILVVDDEQKCVDRHAGLAQLAGAAVIVASGVAEGIAKALAERPDVIITDKDMKDGSGNELAKAVKQVYNPLIAGITGGNPADFDGHYVDAAAAKGLADGDYLNLFRALIANDLSRLADPRKELDDVVNVYAAIDVLAQGVMLAEQVNSGVQPLAGIQLNQVSDEKLRLLLNIDDVFEQGFDLMGNYHELGKKVCKLQKQPGSNAGFVAAAHEFASSPDVRIFLESLAEKKLDGILSQKQYKAYHEAFAKMMEEYGRVK